MERNVNDDCSIEIREEKEGVIAATNLSNQTVRGKRNQQDKVNTVSSNIAAKLVCEAPSPTSTCIFRIPYRIKKLHEKEFVPRLVSIGPFHHGKKNLQAMEAVKLWYLHNLLLRKSTPQANLKHIVEEVTSMEEYCRHCYDENLDHRSEKFVEMMVVDGCFIIELYRKMAKELPEDDVHKTESPDFSWEVVGNDLLLLENQLPWRVVDCLFELTKELDIHNEVPPGKSKSLWELCGKVWKKDLVETVETTSKSRHLLDTYRLLSVEPDNKHQISQLWVSLPSSATELAQIGVEFKRRWSDDKILTITFAHGVMEISPISRLNYLRELRNLVAMEECEPMGPHRYQITSYCRIMNDLIKSTKDVEILKDKKIIPSNTFNSKEIAGFFNDICNNTVTTSSCSASFLRTSLDVCRYYKRRRLQRSIAWIKRDYLYNPSSIWSVSNAVVLVIILTAIQTIYSVLSYHKS